MSSDVKRGVKGFIGDAFTDFHRVKWPTNQEIKDYTINTIVVAIALGLVIGVLDYGLTWLFTYIR